jgi:kumamolisin
MGTADPTKGIRMLVALPIRSRSALEAAVSAIYTPGGASFRQYLTPAEWQSTYAPGAGAIAAVGAGLQPYGVTVARTSTDGLVMELTGTVGAVNTALQTTLHSYQGGGSEQSQPVIYGAPTSGLAPAAFVEAISSVISLDVAVEDDALTQPTLTPRDAGSERLTPADVAEAYDVDPLLQAGLDGQGVRIGVVAGGDYAPGDVTTFLEAFSITRAPPQAIQTMEPPVTTFLETTTDVEWASALAPGATVLVYEAPDRSDTSLVFTMHEAIGRAQATVVTDSFGEYASGTSSSYDDAALEAAALGITFVASSGDHQRPNLPSSSPYVTAVGGTVLSSWGDGGVIETAWSSSGCGASSFAAVSWQAAAAPGASRVTADVALAAANFASLYAGSWGALSGTSLSAPAFASILADVQSSRASQGRPALGWLNSVLYTTPAMQGAFRDITTGCVSGDCEACAGPGWDAPSGWGVVRASVLATTAP